MFYCRQSIKLKNGLLESGLVFRKVAEFPKLDKIRPCKKIISECSELLYWTPSNLDPWNEYSGHFEKSQKCACNTKVLPLKCGHPSNQDTLTGPKGGWRDHCILKTVSSLHVAVSWLAVEPSRWGVTWGLSALQQTAGGHEGHLWGVWETSWGGGVQSGLLLLLGENPSVDAAVATVWTATRWFGRGQCKI